MSAQLRQLTSRGAAMIKKPMLSATVHSHEFEKLQYPMLVSPKLDGIRCLMHPKLGPVTRSFKPVPNKHIWNTLVTWYEKDMLDGELILLDEFGEYATFNETQSGVMTRGGQPRFIFCVFDCFRNPEDPFESRFADAAAIVHTKGTDYIDIVDHDIIKDEEELLSYAAEAVRIGFEGTMIRTPDGPYKSGRSTLNQGWLVKYKEWADAEGSIVGFEERMHNANDDIKDNFGYAKRTSHKANLRPMGTLGALILDTKWGELRVGTGFDDSLRQDIWDRNMVKDLGETDMGHQWIVRGPQPDINRVVTFKYQPFGMQDKPRFPVFQHFREEE